MTTEFKRLTEVDSSEIIELMNNPLVRRHMPLATSCFGESDCEEFIAPWAFVVDGQFVGWGGLQRENGEADLGLVLHPDHWGLGKTLYSEIIRRAFGEMGFEAVTVLLPPTRKNIKGLLRLGFRKNGQLEVADKTFLRYRLEKRQSSIG